MKIIRHARARLDSISQAEWEALSRKRIFFGHQSVGQNIIEGLATIMPEIPYLRLNIRETENPADLGAPVFAHFPIGHNMDPRSKIDDFRKILESGVGSSADIAIFKFCFVDIDHGTDVERLSESYDLAMTSLQKDFPGLRIVTFTVPLTVKPRGLKPMIKGLLGMLPPHVEDNLVRARVNSFLRARFSGSLYDLAAVEAQSAAGAPRALEDAHGAYESMNPAFTNDGGHLNELGRQVVAADLLYFLATLDRK